ncbi:hypothetical protein [Chitinimonas arctica]|nr:hypothetical protein [Chitinimonas arctica]
MSLCSAAVRPMNSLATIAAAMHASFCASVKRADKLKQASNYRLAGKR